MSNLPEDLGEPLARSKAPKHRELGTDGEGRWERQVMAHWWQHAGGSSGLVWSFEEAAKVLTGRQLDPSNRHDGSFPPIAFAWRHTIELALKRGVVFLSRQAGGVPLSQEEQKALGSHNLQALWEAWHTRQQAIAPEWDPRAIEKAERVLNRLIALAPDPSTFRYVTNQKGEVFELPERVDVAEFGSAMEHVVGTVMFLEDHLGDAS